MASVDVSVRGAGIFGLSIAWACHQAGATVELVDPNGLGAGASGGIVGALAPHVPENWNPKKQFQFESLILAERFWAEVAEASGQDPGYTRAGRIQPLADDNAVALARERAAGAQSLWQGKAVWDVTRDPGGWQLPSASGFYVRDTLSAHIHPRKACAALAKALNVPILHEPHAKAGATVWATGVAGLEALNASHTREMGRGIKGQAALLRVNFAGLPQVFADTLHIIPHLDGTVAIGSTTERDFDTPTGTDAHLEHLIQRARNAVPDLRGAEVIERWAGLRPRARSRAPMLGALPGQDGHFIANGGFKIGFGMAPKIASTMSQLILDGHDTIPEGFDLAESV